MKQHGERETTGLAVSGQAATRRSELPCFHELTHQVAAAEGVDRRCPSKKRGGGGGYCEGLGRHVRWLFGWKEEMVGGEGGAGVKTPWGGGGSLLQRERERERERALGEREQRIGQGGLGGLWGVGGGGGEGGGNSAGCKKVQWDLMRVKMLHVCICRCVPQTLNPKNETKP
jgi:hypothetical protein